MGSVDFLTFKKTDTEIQIKNMKISKFCWGMNLTDAANSLGIYGMVMSVLGLIGGAMVFVLPFIPQLGLFGFEMLGVGAAILLIKGGWFYFSYQLYKRNSNNDAQGVKKIIKIGSYIIGSFQAICSAIALLYGTTLLVLMSVYGGFSVFGIVLTIVGGIWLIFPSLLLHGIRTKNPRKMKPWIVFKIVMLCLQLIMSFIWSLNYGMILMLVLQVIALILLYSYSTGMVIVHYNIVLEDQNVLDSALENFSNEKPSKIDMNSMMTDLQPPYSQVV